MEITIKLNAFELQQAIKDGSLNALAEAAKTASEAGLAGAQLQWDATKGALAGKDGKF